MAYVFGRKIEAGYPETVARVREALAREGFGIISEIDVAAKFREKLGKEFRDYLILGACNPALAFEGLSREIDLGALLPCNVIVYAADGGGTMVNVMDPVTMLSVVGRPEMQEMAEEVAARLRRAVASL